MTYKDLDEVFKIGRKIFSPLVRAVLPIAIGAVAFKGLGKFSNYCANGSARYQIRQAAERNPLEAYALARHLVEEDEKNNQLTRLIFGSRTSATEYLKEFITNGEDQTQGETYIKEHPETRVSYGGV